MNEQLQSALAKIIEKAIVGIDSSIAFMQAELPEVVEQLLVWYAVKGLMLSLIGLIMILFGVTVATRAIKSRPDSVEGFKETFLWKKGEYTWNRGDVVAKDDSVIVIVLTVVFSIVLGFIFLSFNLMEPIQILVAPKVWLIEYASTLVK